ncbi:MAG: NHL repeat-containing protein [Opitutaceae bacterium]|nr:NHL repeat-containing protein [Opitutaceae bacterium]
MSRFFIALLLGLLGMACLSTYADAQVLVSDFNLDRIVRYDADGANPTVLVASSSGGLDLPHRTRIGPDGLLYVSSAGTDQILRYHATTGAFIDVFVGSTNGLDYPVDFLFRPDGYLYVSSQANSAILRYNATTGVLDAGWSAQHASLSGPSGIVFDDTGHLYVAGRFSNNLLRFDATTGAHQLTFGNVPLAHGLALLPDGRLLVASGQGNTVEAFAAPDSAAPAQSTLVTGLTLPVGLEVDPLTGSLLVASYGSGSISRHALADGTLLGTFGTGDLLSGPNYFTVLTAVPEPSATAALFGGAVLVAAASRRRRTY